MLNKVANPIDAIIDFAISAGADTFWINNAKDELKKLREIKQIEILPVAYAKINDRGDLYDLRLQNNPYNDQTKIVPLYRINTND
jgi:hypothetical protein